MSVNRKYLINYGPRKFVVVVNETADLKGYEAFYFAFQSILDSDPQLKAKTGRVPSFSYHDDLFDEYVELCPGQNIPEDVKILHLKFLDPNESPTKMQETGVAFPETRGNIGPATRQVLQTAVKKDTEQEPTASHIIIDDEVSKALAAFDAEEFPLVINVEEQEMKVEPSTSTSSDNSALQPGDKDELAAGKSATDSKEETDGKRKSLKYPTPVWSENVQTMINDGAVKYNPSALVIQATAFLRSLVDYPTPKEYAAYARTLVEKIPDLAEYDDDNDYIYTALSNKISNRMRYDRLKKKEAMLGKIAGSSCYQRANVNLGSKTKRMKKSNDNAADTTIKTEKIDDENDVEMAPDSPKSNSGEKEDTLVDGVPCEELLKQLEEPIKDITVLRSLLLRTYEARRPVIVQAVTMTEIWEKWPNLKNADCITYEHSLIDTAVEDFEENFKAMIVKLNKIFSGGNEKSMLSSSVSQVKLLAKLEAALHPKEKETTQKALTLTKPSGLKPDEVCANAALMLVVTAKVKISQAFLCAEDKVVCELQNPSCLKVIHTLLSSYYAFHREYPSCSFQFYKFLERFLLKKDDFTGNSDYKKFLDVYHKV